MVDYMEMSLDEAAVKALVKKAVAEVLAENRELLVDVVGEALEDAGLVQAIQATEKDDMVLRDEVFRMLGEKN
jgi:hypothetical protein